MSESHRGESKAAHDNPETRAQVKNIIDSSGGDLLYISGYMFSDAEYKAVLAVSAADAGTQKLMKIKQDAIITSCIDRTLGVEPSKLRDTLEKIDNELKTMGTMKQHMQDFRDLIIKLQDNLEAKSTKAPEPKLLSLREMGKQGRIRGIQVDTKDDELKPAEAKKPKGIEKQKGGKLTKGVSHSVFLDDISNVFNNLVQLNLDFDTMLKNNDGLPDQKKMDSLQVSLTKITDSLYEVVSKEEEKEKNANKSSFSTVRPSQEVKSELLTILTKTKEGLTLLTSDKEKPAPSKAEAAPAKEEPPPETRPRRGHG